MRLLNNLLLYLGCIILSIILSIILILLIVYLKLDELDRYSVKLVLKYSKFLCEYLGERVVSVNDKLFTNIINILFKTLFCNKYQLAIYTEGFIYNGVYLLEYYKDVFDKYESKLEWAKIFNKYNINHPKILYKCYNGELIENFQSEMIFKPDIGGLGNGIKKIDHVPKCQDKNWLLQEMLKDCDSKKPRHYRIITFYTGEIFCIYQYNATDNEVASNHAQGGTGTLMYYKNKLLNNLHTEIYNISKELSNINKSEFPFVFSIGWDVILHCKNHDRIPYVLEGNFLHGVWLDFDKKFTYEDKLFIDDYKKIIYISQRTRVYLEYYIIFYIYLYFDFEIISKLFLKDCYFETDFRF